MRIYVDNNILVSIEDNEISIDDLKGFFGKNAHFVYSYIHLQELMEAKDNFEELKMKRFDTLRKLTNNIQIRPIISIAKKFYLVLEEPESLLTTLRECNDITERLRISANNFDKVDRNKLIEKLSIDKKRINNYTENEVIAYLNEALKVNLELNIKELINPMGAFMHEQICSIFNFLDFVGFWKDKNSSKSNMARMYDASHAYFASGCDFFVSNDLRARMKSKVAYEFKDIKTQVIDWKIQN